HQSRPAEAEAMFWQTLQRRAATLGPRDRLTQLTALQLADLLIEQARGDQAKPLLLQTLLPRLEVFAEELPRGVSGSGSYVAPLQSDPEVLREAATVYEAEVKRGQAQRGGGEFHTLAAAYLLAAVRFQMGQVREAEHLYRSALDGFGTAAPGLLAVNDL